MVFTTEVVLLDGCEECGVVFAVVVVVLVEVGCEE